jgi:ERCC4-type nuclease
MKFMNGTVSKTVFERKSIGDVFGTMTSGYKRFRREIFRAKTSGIVLILIIEGSLSKVARGYKRSRVHPQQIVKTLFSLWVRYGIVPVFAKDRMESAEIIVQYFTAEFRRMESSDGKV